MAALEDWEIQADRAARCAAEWSAPLIVVGEDGAALQITGLKQ